MTEEINIIKHHMQYMFRCPVSTWIAEHTQQRETQVAQRYNIGTCRTRLKTEANPNLSHRISLPFLEWKLRNDWHVHDKLWSSQLNQT